jgi:predicted permease
MTVFLTLLAKLVPLYIVIFLGYIAAKVLNAEKETVAKLLIYIIAPVVIFYGTYTATLDSSILILPAFFFVLCSLTAFIFL